MALCVPLSKLLVCGTLSFAPDLNLPGKESEESNFLSKTTIAAVRLQSIRFELCSLLVLKKMEVSFLLQNFTTLRACDIVIAVYRSLLLNLMQERQGHR